MARRLAPVLAGAVLAVAVWERLTRALPWVANRHAFNWDSGRRAILNVEAADQLRAHQLWAFFGSVCGPETWPTFRLTLAAMLHLAAGQERALEVELGLSLAFTAVLFLVLGFAARQLASAPWNALLVLAVSSAALLGARALFVQSANGMLEVPSATFTLASATAWLSSREPSSRRLWPVAVLGNLLFHIRWQHGLIFAAAVILTEVGAQGLWSCTSAMLGATIRACRKWLGATLLTVGGALTAILVWVLVSGGAEGTLFGQPYSVRSIDGPVAFAALAFFVYLQLALWWDRAHLAEQIPERVRFFWTWLLTPMVGWLLIPFSWRLRTLARISAYDMIPPPQGVVNRLLFYPRAAWESWSPLGIRWLMLGLLLATVVAAWRSQDVRRRVLPLAVVIVVELTALVLLSRRNYQQRFLLNLVPLIALLAAAWIPSIRSKVPRALVGMALAGALGLLALPAWATPALASTLSEGFVDRETGDACRAVADAVPIMNGGLLNQTSLEHRQSCAMWVTFFGRQRGARLEVHSFQPRPTWDEALLLVEGCDALVAPVGFAPDGAAFHSGPVCAQRYRTLAQPTR